VAPVSNADSQPRTRREKYIPQVITGDLDSLRPEVREFYSSRGCKIVTQKDQDRNDLTKCLDYLDASQGYVCIYGGTGGRFDQSMASLSSLFKFHSKFPRLLLIDEETTVTLLKATGRGEEHVLRMAGREGPLCGLVAMEGAVKCTTGGLKWNIEDGNYVLGFGGEGIVSSSNEFVLGREVRVTCDGSLAWTTHLRNEESENKGEKL